MRGVQRSALGKWIAAVCLLASAFLAGLLGVRCLEGLSYFLADSWQETSAFYTLLSSREEELMRLYTLAHRYQGWEQEMDYVERQELQDMAEQVRQRMAPTATNFRFQIVTGDGEEVVYTNLEGGQELEDQVSAVYYAPFTTQDSGWASNQWQLEEDLSSGEDGSSQAEQDQNSGTYVIRCGVITGLEESGVKDEFSLLPERWSQAHSTFQLYAAAALVLLAACLVSMGWLAWSGGWSSRWEGPALTWQDRIFSELYLIFSSGGVCAALYGMMAMGQTWESLYYADPVMDSYSAYFSLLGMGLAGLCAVLAGVAALTLRTLAVRLKTRSLGKTTLTCRLALGLWRLLKLAGGGLRDFVLTLPLTWRVITLFLFYLVLKVIAWSLRYSFGPLLLLAVDAGALFVLCWWTVSFRRLQKGGQAIAAGNLNHQIDTSRMPHDLRRHAQELNNISAGLSAALEEKIKSERFKAELITNVSHDLKTPLTSIINYVNLLKTTQQTDPTAREYIEVLDRKSQRLKKLTEDLVEASKASTGVLSVNREKISMGQLMDQALGEWMEKLEERRLTVVTDLPEGETWVYADGRHLWRVIDNLLSNCAKYAMEGTRIYLELVRGTGQVVLSVKNISREALNIPPERLMERFVRGEDSRTTEGSGLGLSLARSLTELQGGTFEVTVDGDLFKAVVTLPQGN